MTIRQASIDDILLLASHHRRMFEEMWLARGQCLVPATAEAVEDAYIRKLRAEMPGGVCRAWIIEDGGLPVSSGAATLISLTPNPYDLSPKVVFFHSMFTEKSHRNKKCAQSVVKAVEEWCAKNGIRRIILSASDAGRPVYQKLGFCDASEMMRLFVENTDEEET